MTNLAATFLAEPDPQRGGIIFKLLFLIFVVLVVAILYLVRVPLLRFAGEFWIVDDAPESSDVIIVLSGDNYDAVRAARAAALFRAAMAPHVVATGRSLRSYATTTDLMKRDLTDHGVPAAAIIPLTHRADNTRDEAVAVSEFVASHHWKKILLVTSNYHTRLSEYIYERTLPPGTQLRVISAPDIEYDPQSWWRTREGLKIFFHEVGKYIAALWEMRHNDVRTN
ncbi:MAG TPA: YdcF family protein [Candidatus Acidoferrales bacterium]|nr:YdcF family protein [Candidatus Acidoferrales bacterium]